MTESKSLDVLSEPEQVLMKSIIRSVEYEVMVVWVRRVSMKMAKDSKFNDLAKKKEKKG
jgi:hypothetical protein